MTRVDLQPAVDRIIEITGALPAGDSRPTPCADWPVAELLAHLRGLAIEFRAAAEKAEPEGASDEGTPQDTDDLDERLREMATAWLPADAWEGTTRVAGMDLSGELTGRVALGELVLHGWDLARATHQPYSITDVESDVLERTCRELRRGNDGEIPGLFGPVVALSPGAEPFERVLALSGRDPNWEPA